MAKKASKAGKRRKKAVKDLLAKAASAVKGDRQDTFVKLSTITASN